ncbi:P-loop containing nucleoside triphosphate hydrolase protein [Mycena floridula]|nr:P-loop containing nucleoside triphosphate hydrolase protein [Mycena floridula]
MTEQAYELVCAVINCCEDAIELAPAFLHSITILISTFQKVVCFMQENTKGNLVKRLLHHQQIGRLLEDCMASLQHASTLFKVQLDIMTATRMVEMQAAASKRHTELLDFINQSSQLALQELRQSSSSVSILLPAAPKIFYGREDALNHISNALCQHKSAKVAILGPGGIGKTSVAQATLHDLNVVQKYGSQRYWIACDSSESANDLLVVVSASFGINTHSHHLHAILACLRVMNGPVLLVLDNLETPWEGRRTRLEIEELLSHLTGVDNLSLLITMRGSERPAQVQWTRPFLPPLGPISTEAARRTFVAISDADEADPQLGQLLSLTDNVPLAVSLMASVVEAEGCTMALSRWNHEGTRLLSEGVDRRNNLEKSIEVSLCSARFQSAPDTHELLSILSYLPDGITSSEFDQINFQLSNISHCRSILCRTSLAYITADDRMKLLAPIREYIQKSYPPSLPSILAIRNYFFKLVTLAEEIYKIPALLHKFTSNIGNIHFTIQIALDETDMATVRPALDLLCSLTHLYMMTQMGSFDLLESCSRIIDRIPHNSQLRGDYCMAMYWAIPADKVKDQEAVCLESIQCAALCGVDYSGLTPLSSSVHEAEAKDVGAKGN